MLRERPPISLSRVLATRMTLAALLISFLLAIASFLFYLMNTSQLREATLHANALAIAKALAEGKDPAALPLFREYPDSYGFRVFDRRLLAKRHVLASANTRWLPPVQRPASTPADPDGNHDTQAVGTDLLEGFQRYHSPEAPKGRMISLLIHRVVVTGHKYWVQTYMIGDPARMWFGVIRAKLLTHVFLPVFFIVPALTLAMFWTTRRALLPLRKLSRDAVLIGSDVARGRALTPVSGRSMVREFADVAAAINVTLAKLEHSLQLQRQFTSDAAHELRTPLSVLLLEAAQLPHGGARDRIKGDLEDLGRLVNELLRFAQAEDVMAYELADLDLVSATRRVCEEAAVKAVERDQLIELDCMVPELIVQGNLILIEIAIRNLIDNALKYSSAGSTISVRVESGGGVVVEDCGPGIPPEHRAAVFDRFWRADRHSTNGFGVGLALVRRIAQLHEGSVSLENRASGIGTRMTFNLRCLPAGDRLLQKA